MQCKVLYGILNPPLQRSRSIVGATLAVALVPCSRSPWLAVAMRGDESMSTQHTFGTFNRDSGSLTLQGATRSTGKLLASQGYVVGIEISGSGARQSVALADLQGKILYR